MGKKCGAAKKLFVNNGNIQLNEIIEPESCQHDASRLNLFGTLQKYPFF